MAIVYTPMNEDMSIFLAGTIDNGNSVDWQKEVINGLRDENIIIYNPRRDNWDSSAGSKQVYEQIEWEQYYLDKCDKIIMVFQDTSLSPITFLELGQYANSGKLEVFCTEKFYRYENVKFTCDMYNINLHNTTDSKEIVDEIKKIYNKQQNL